MPVLHRGSMKVIIYGCLLPILNIQHEGGNDMILLRINFLQKRGSDVYSDLNQPVSTSVDDVNTEVTDVGLRVTELLNNMGAHSQGFLSIHTDFCCL